MRILNKVIFFALISMQCFAAPAATPVQAMFNTRTSTLYAVSGILRSGADSNIIKLVQGIHLASSSDEAAGVFSREVLARYPGYSLMDTVVTPVPVAKRDCGQSVQENRLSSSKQ